MGDDDDGWMDGWVMPMRRLVVGEDLGRSGKMRTNEVGLISGL